MQTAQNVKMLFAKSYPHLTQAKGHSADYVVTELVFFLPLILWVTLKLHLLKSADRRRKDFYSNHVKI
jgi:hypothetical protein